MMGEKQENDHRAANTAKRPSPTSVKELLDIVHLQQTTVTRKTAVKQDADLLSSRAFNPLPAIGKSSGSPPVSVISPPKNRPGGDEYRSRANSDGCQYKGVLRSGTLPSNVDVNSGAGTMPSLQSPRESGNHTVTGRQQHQGRRDGTLPPLSELIVENPQSRPKQLDAAKTPLRRTASGGSHVPSPAFNTSLVQKNDERNKLVRPKSSHGRRRPLPSEITEIHNSVPAPYEDNDVFKTNSTSPRDGNNVRSTPGYKRDSDSSSRSNQRPKSSKGRARPSVTSTRSLSQGDEWSSEEDMRPRAPSPPSPGLDSDLDSDNDRYDNGSNGRIVRPR